MSRWAGAALGVMLIALGLASLFPVEALHLVTGYHTVGLSGDGLFYIGVAGSLALIAGVVLLVSSRKVPR